MTNEDFLDILRGVDRIIMDPNESADRKRKARALRDKITMADKLSAQPIGYSGGAVSENHRGGSAAAAEINYEG